MIRWLYVTVHGDPPFFTSRAAIIACEKFVSSLVDEHSVDWSGLQGMVITVWKFLIDCDLILYMGYFYERTYISIDAFDSYGLSFSPSLFPFVSPRSFGYFY